MLGVAHLVPDDEKEFSAAAVLLAAGAGSRLGGRPKSLLQVNGQPLIRRLLAAFSAAGIDEIVIVLGHYSEQIAPVIADLTAKIVLNPAPQDGLVSSQRLGLASLSGRADAVLMALADQPLIDAGDIAGLLEFWQVNRRSADVVYPQVQGQRGNPVVLSAAAREQILSDGEQVGCRDWQRANAGRTMPFATSNRHYRVDLDTEADLVALQRETGWSLQWPAC